MPELSFHAVVMLIHLVQFHHLKELHNDPEFHMGQKEKK